MARRIEIFDTTLRDGNKLPFAVLSPADRLQLAHQLERLGVDVIETGFPAASEEEAACVSRICAEVKG
ncbi:MAG: 2-isopropylmalate synthase, partial [Spirochaetia bacterium]